MSKKVTIIISLIAVVVVAGGTIGALLIYKPKSTTSTAVATTSTSASFNNHPKTFVVTKPDLSKDYGACTLLDKNSLKTTLGKTADKLQGPDNMGIGQLGNGDSAQTCVYSFISGGTMTNGFNLSDGFNVEVYEFKNKANETADIAGFATDSVAISGLGDQSLYVTVNGSTTKSNQYMVRVYSGLKLYIYTISEPLTTATFTSDTAKAALITIAKSVTY